MNQITTIDQVINHLDEIIKTSIETNSPDGYFAALYRKVTIAVKEGISNDFFDDGPRMEKLDVIFATRYIEAYQSYQNGQTITASWKKSFDEATNRRPIVLQHLLFGMNAHINLDLGVAAVSTMNGQSIQPLENDFNKINKVLSNLVGEVQNDLAQIWPALKWILKLAGKIDDFLADFSMKLARDGAWRFATKLSAQPTDKRPDFIKERDEKVSKKARIITHPGFLVNFIFRIVRWGEKGTVAERIVDLRD